MPSAGERVLSTGLVYAALSSGIVSSLGMLLVPSVAAEMQVPVNSAQWMLTVNLLVGAVATPIMGRLSDGARKRRLFVVSLGVILVGSLVCATADDFAVFQVGRALQGLAYGVFPVAISICRGLVSRPRLRATMSTLAVTGAAGAGIGYPLTGVLAQLGGFRLAFVFGALFMATAMAVVLFVVPRDRPVPLRRGRFDVLGAVLLGGGLTALLLTVSEAPVWGWLSPSTIAMAAASVGLLAAWVLASRRTRRPLVDLRVLRDPDIAIAHGTAIALGATMYMVLSVSSLVAQAPQSTGYGAALPLVWAGFVMLPFTIGSLIANRVVRRLRGEHASRLVLPAGAIVVMTSAALLAIVHDSLVWVLLGMFLNGLGVGSTYAALPLLIARRVAADEFGSAVSFNQVLRTVGGSVGSAIAAAVFAAALAPTGFPSSAGITFAYAVSAAGSAVTVVLLSINIVRRGRGSTT
ncbi:MFS transporter [Microbacterium sp. CPCC 204701]|uniref:MFS transporter n=1 Tax=Microbacterium sp. CPCC 204701 TaxID=2493084 RepID=UPI00197BA8B8|nr:MFS transporter [Microbacterium sp. CPCC 204701]